MKAKFAISQMELFHGVILKIALIVAQHKMVKHVIMFGKDHILLMTELM